MVVGKGLWDELYVHTGIRSGGTWEYTYLFSPSGYIYLMIRAYYQLDILFNTTGMYDNTVSSGYITDKYQ